MIRIVTTFSSRQWNDYARTLIEKNLQLWPREIEWQLWVDNDAYSIPDPADICHGNNASVKFLADDPEHEAFMAAWNERVRKNPALKHEITVKRYPTGYLLDAGTFSHKIFSFTGMEARQHTDWLIFLGSDVETLSPISMDWLKGILQGDVVHLGRKDIRSSETDWLAVNVGECENCNGERFLDALRHIYVSGDVYNGAEWIDGYVTARLIAAFEGMKAQVINLSDGLDGLDVFERTILGQNLRHWKGPHGKRTLQAKIAAGKIRG